MYTFCKLSKILNVKKCFPKAFYKLLYFFERQLYCSGKLVPTRVQASNNKNTHHSNFHN